MTAGGRTALWRSLLARLAENNSELVLLKNVESTLYGTGDLDVLLRRERLGAMVRTARDWCRENSGETVVCHHVPDGPHVVMVFPDESHALVLDAKWRRSLFGTTLLDARQAEALSVSGTLGPMMLGAGAEALVKACLYGLDRSPALNRRLLEAKGVPGELAADPEGVAAAARAMHPPTAYLQLLARSVQGGRAGLVTAVAGKAVLLSMASAEPMTGWRRLHYKAFVRARCPVMTMVKHAGRRVPRNRVQWLSESEEAHRDSPW